MPDFTIDRGDRLPTFAAPKPGEEWVELDPHIPLEKSIVRITEAFNLETGRVRFIRLSTGKKGQARLSRFNGRSSGFGPRAWAENRQHHHAHA